MNRWWRKRSKGQAIVEMALVIAIYFAVALGAIGEGLQIDARVQVASALREATVSALQAPLGDKSASLAYATTTFKDSVVSTPWLVVTFAGCSGSYLNGVRDTSVATGEIVCTATDVAVNYQEIPPLTMLWPSKVVIASSMSAKAHESNYRTCFMGLRCSGF